MTKRKASPSGTVLKQYTLECRVCLPTDGFEATDKVIRDAFGQAAKTLYDVGWMMGVVGDHGEPPCSVVIYSDDFFNGLTKLDLLDKPSG